MTAERPRPLSPEEAQQVQEHLLEQIAQGANHCRELEAQLRKHPAPELETIIKTYRVLVLKLSAQVQAAPELRHLITTLFKPVMDWARLEEKRKDRELAEQKHREEAAARLAAKAGQQKNSGDALNAETLEMIEHELHLF